MQAETEKRIQIGAQYQIADICIPDRKKIIEVQLSTQDDVTYYERHEFYRQAGYETLWITWKKSLDNCPYARLAISSEGGVILENKKDIPTANLIRVMSPTINFSEPRSLHWYQCWDDLIDFCLYTLERSKTLRAIVETFVLDTAKFKCSCSISTKPHWCGQKCTDLESQIPKIKRRYETARDKFREQERIKRRKIRENKIAFLRKFYPSVYRGIHAEYASHEIAFYIKHGDPNIEEAIEQMIIEQMIKSVDTELECADSELEQAKPVIVYLFPISHDLSIYTKQQFLKHFDGTEYSYSIEIDLKYAYRDVYQAARVAHENRMLNLKRDIPTVCQKFLDNIKNMDFV